MRNGISLPPLSLWERAEGERAAIVKVIQVCSCKVALTPGPSRERRIQRVAPNRFIKYALRSTGVSVRIK